LSNVYRGLGLLGHESYGSKKKAQIVWIRNFTQPNFWVLKNPNGSKGVGCCEPATNRESTNQCIESKRRLTGLYMIYTGI
jgi:hypothetical protein